MTVGIIDFLEVYRADERFLVFAASSLVLLLGLLPLMRGASGASKLFLGSGAFLIAFAFVVLAPLSFLNVLGGSPMLSPVGLNFNFGFLALGLGLMVKFRSFPNNSIK